MYQINFKPRLYQETIFSNAALYNSLVVLPTGLGKTAIALMLAIHRLKIHPEKKILILAPTKPLVEQHHASFSKHTNLLPDELAIFTGSVSPAKRKEIWPKVKVIIATPQGVENDLINGSIDLSEVSLITFDEAHRATGNFSYVWICKQYVQKSSCAKILALTASPGTDLESIKEVMNNLFIEKIDLRTLDDPDVKPYVQNTDVKWLNVELPQEFLDVLKKLKNLLSERLKQMKYLGYLHSIALTKSELLRFQASLQHEIAEKGYDENLLKTISLAAEALKIEHAIELVETQGITAVRNYFKDLVERSQNTKNKSVINLVNDYNFKIIVNQLENMHDAELEHPKIKQLLVLLDGIFQKDKKMIIFTQYRDSGDKLCSVINDYFKDSVAKLFIGQANKRQKGLSQKKQIELLDQFRNNEFQILVSSSVGEEGLDIPQVDYVIFYEPIPSAIRSIQRRGRTGRNADGSIFVLVAKNTRDEAYKWASIRKEKNMHNILKDLEKSDLRVKLMKQDVSAKANDSILDFVKKDAEKKEQAQDATHEQDISMAKTTSPTQTANPATDITNTAAQTNLLPQNPNNKIKIIIDYREKNSPVIKHLIDNETNVKLDQLAVGDYLLSKDVAVEFKTDEDFVNSIVDGRLLNQLKVLKQAFKKPVIVVEGNRDIYSIRKVHPNAIRGILATIAVSYNIPILFTANAQDTALLLKIIAAREQIDDEKKEFSHHFEKPVQSVKEMQEYIVSAFPGIGATLAKPLLKEFRTVKSIVNSTEAELKNIEKIGSVKARNLFDLFNSEYED